MLIVLPIKSHSHYSDWPNSQSLKFTLEYFPDGYSFLAYLALVHRNAVTDFINDVCILLVDGCERFEDESLASYAYDMANRYCSSDAFGEWLEQFHAEQNLEYNRILKGVSIDDCTHAMAHPTKLIIRI